MTWVIAVPSLYFGAGILYSDIRVGTQDGRYFDGVRKVHFIGNHAALGFAGDIQTGFEIVDDCRGRFAADCAVQEYGADHQGVEGETRELTLVANPAYHRENVTRYARERFAAAPPARQTASCELILCVAERDVTYMGGMIPRVHTWRLVSPDFEPETVPVGDSRWIGSGGNVERYTTVARSALAEPEQERLGGMARWNVELGAKALGGAAIADAIELHPTSDVSPHMHVTTVEPQRVTIATNDIHRGVESRRMPVHAETWDQLVAIARAQGLVGAVLVGYRSPRCRPDTRVPGIRLPGLAPRASRLSLPSSLH